MRTLTPLTELDIATVTPAWIDEEINKHLLSLSNLRTVKNSFSPIFRLPPEILATIFTHGARDYYYSNSPLVCIPHWVNVSYICRRWRDVALNCPTLWTYHFTASLRWTKELLARSKDASLKIRIHLYLGTRAIRPIRWWSCLVEELLSHAERIQDLHLHVPSTVLPSQPSLYALRLQILDIQSSSSTSPDWTLTNNNQDTPPTIRILKLANCSLPWHTLNLSGLTTLFLCRVPARSRLNIVEFLAALSRMQGLTTLHLDCALTSTRGVVFDVSTAIGLPCLTWLFVVAPLSTVVALLSCTDIPLKTKLTLEFELEDGSSAADYAQIPSILAQRFTPSKDLSSLSPTIRSLSIRYLPSQPTFALYASEHGNYDPCVSVSDAQWSPRPLLVIYVKLATPSDLNPIASDLCCSIPSTDVQTLLVVGPPQSNDFWRKLLGHLHGLRHLRLGEGIMPNLASLLGPTARAPVETHVTSGDHDLTPGHVLVPTLERLELRNVTFEAEDDENTTISKKSLLDALATRKGHPRVTGMDSCGVLGEQNTNDDEDEEEGSLITSDYSDEGYY